MRRNNVRFLPGTATYGFVSGISAAGKKIMAKHFCHLWANFIPIKETLLSHNLALSLQLQRECPGTRLHDLMKMIRS